MRPVAERHDCKKHEDAADPDNEDDHHDHRVAVALFDYSHANIGQACRVQEKKRNIWRKSKKNARSEDVVWSRRRSAGRHKEKEKVCMSGCLIVWDEKE